MRSLILSIASLLLFNMQADAQQPSPISVTKSYSTNVTINSDVAVKKKVDVQDNDQDASKVKTFTKTFALDKNDKVILANQYGSITIKTWDRKEIKVDADIRAYANTDTEAQKLLDDASITASQTSDLVTFKTLIEEYKGSSWNWGKGSYNGKKWRREVKVYLTVYMPSDNSLTASQSYGNIVMGDFSGPTSLKVQYGNLTVGNLTNSNNYIAVDYGKAVANHIDQAKIRLQYGGGLTINSIGDVDLNADYTNVNIAQLKGNAISRMQYGKLTITEVLPTCKIIDVKADYTNVNLGFSPNYNADFNVATNYGGFKYSDAVTAKQDGSAGRNQTFSKKYTGQIGKGGMAKVTIGAEYCSVTFK